MTTLSTDSVRTNLLAFPSNWDVGVSGGANALKEEAMELLKGVAQTMTIGRHYWETQNSLAGVLELSTVSNWDGYGARALDPISRSKAIWFSTLLPMDVPIPDVSVDTDGEVRFEWYRSPRQVFSVTVSSRSELAYAGLFGASEAYGTEYLSDELPDSILDNINRVYA